MEQQLNLQGVIGIAIILTFVTLLVLWMKNKRSRRHKTYQGKEHHLMETLIREQEKGRRLHQRVEMLEQEVALLKQDLNQMADQQVNLSNDSVQVPFHYNLQFQSFMQNNQELVLLLKDGLSVEEVAKATNRSIREIEMIEAVIKQRNTTGTKASP